MNDPAPAHQGPDGAIKVAICITGLQVGGAETFLAELMAVRPADLEVRVFSLIDGGPIVDRLTAVGIPVAGLHMSAGRPSIRSLLDLAGHLRRFRPDILHTWMYHADLVGGLAAKLARVPRVIWHLHNSDLSPERARLLTRIVARLCAVLSHWIPDVILSCSESGARVHMALGYARDRFLVVPNGVDAERFYPDASARASVGSEFGLDVARPRVGLIARVDAQKNHEGFFEAVRAFYERGGDADFLLAGRDVTPDHWQLKGWREATGHADRLTLVGPRSDVPRIMASLDIVTSSSLGEAFPLVLIEAMACGVPCVATDVGDAALIVADTGTVVPPNDAVAMATAWRRLLDMPKERRVELGRRARARAVANYSIRDVAERIWDLYRRLAGNRA